MGQAIGFTQVFPNATFTATATVSVASIVIPITDIFGLTAAEAASFSVNYKGYSAADTVTADFVGNAEKIIWGILKTYEAEHLKIDAAYTADQALATASQFGSDIGPTAISFGNGFSSLQSASGGKLKQNLNLSFLYPTPAVDLVDEDD